MTVAACLLRLYDEQLRLETVSAASVARRGPLRLATYGGGRGFVTYPQVGDADAIDRLVPEALAHYRADPVIVRVEWKTRACIEVIATR